MKQEKWVIAAKRADFQAIGEKFSIDPLIARLIRNRDIVGDIEIEKYLHGTLKELHDPMLMKDMALAVAILQQKLREHKRIRVIGDYDIDGIMSTYILTRGLELLGGSVDAVLPHRIQDGYGLNDELISHAHEAGVDTILTCDNGIAAFSQIAYADRLGMTVIVTDHHEVPYEEAENGRIYQLPPAAAVVDPKQPDCAYPFSGICGAVVAFKLMQALFAAEGLDQQLVITEFLEMAAFATVGDVMELVDENRILVKYGLEAIRHSENPGIRALIEACMLGDKKLTAYHIGFILGPCLNATGRLDTAQRALSLLQCRDREEAMQIAMDLRHLNESRKELTQRGVEEAQRLIGQQGLAERRVLILYLPDCHESLAGIIAGRIREAYGKPVFVLTDAEDGVKGSGRSIESYSMYEEMSRCKDLFTKYGGHKMAAGLSMPKENVQAFMDRMEAGCSLTADDLVEKVTIDATMPFSYVNQRLVEQLSLLEPFGVGNKKPLFAQKNLSLLHSRLLGKSQKAGKYTVLDENGCRYELLYFGDQKQLQAYWQEKQRLSVTYYPELNSFRGKSEIQLIMQGYM